MIILGGLLTGITFGPHGITPAQIAVGGSASSPLLNDVDPGDDATELLWRLEPTYLTAGATAVTDTGIYQLTGAPDGTHTQPYRLFALPATGAPLTSTNNIITVVGTPATAPSITLQPQAQNVTVGDAAAFAVTATGTAPLAYQWLRNGSAISGATAASYVLTSAQLGDSGAAFSVQVSNAAGTTTSASATLTVQSAAGIAPSIAVQPQSQTVAEGQPATFSAAATGTAPLAYQWRRNSANISGATSASYTFTPLLADSGAAYTMLASNAFGSVQTSAALLTVLPSTSAPIIIAQPQTQVLDDGSTATLQVTAVGAGPMAYQWRKDGTALAGATQAVLQVPNVNLLDNHTRYQVVVTNAFGQATSAAAELLVPVVSLAEARSGARIDDNRFDGDIPRWVDAAVRLAEQFCNRFFTPKTPAFDRPRWPAASDTFPISGATSCTASYWTGTAWALLAAEALAVFADGSRTGIAPAAGTSWPELGEVVGGPRVRLSFTAGPTSAASLPVEVRHFIIAHVSLWADENRAAAPQAAQNFPWLYAGIQPLTVY